MPKFLALCRYGFIVIFCLAVSLTSSCVMKEPELIPREILFGNPVKTSPQISPHGKMIAYLAPDEDVLNVWVKTIGADDDRPVTRDRKRGIRRYFWAGDSRNIMFLQDADGDENWRLYGVNIETGQVRNFTPFEKVNVRIVEWNKHFPDQIIIAMNKDNEELHDAYRLTVSTGELQLVARNPGNVLGWVADAQLKVRGALASDPRGGTDLLIREDENSPWKEIVSWDLYDASISSPVSFSADGTGLYIIDSRDVNAGRLIKMDLSTGDFSVIAQDKQYDVDGVLINPDTYEVQAVYFTRARTEWIVLDESVKGDFEKIRGLDQGDFFIYNRDNADDTWVIGFIKDNGPVSFYAFERQNRKGRFLFEHKPDLRKYTLAEMEPVSFTSRDGFVIHGYITYPPGKRRSHLPLVLNVHGGPWSRDTWGYDPVAQWLANRGYVCLQVNFRGSTGYGKEFINAGNREWGGKMHDDLIDAVNWVIEKGIADPDRIAIYGASYGGYAALAGATFTPEVFCCAIDVVGPSNLITFLNTMPPYWSAYRNLVYQRVGDPRTDEEFLKSRSPLFKVDCIKIPLLVAQGANDPRVKKAESEQVVQALKEKGIEHEYLLFPDEGHGFARPQNRIEFFRVAEKFLARYLGGRYEE